MPKKSKGNKGGVDDDMDSLGTTLSSVAISETGGKGKKGKSKKKNDDEEWEVLEAKAVQTMPKNDDKKNPTSEESGGKSKKKSKKKVDEDEEWEKLENVATNPSPKPSKKSAAKPSGFAMLEVEDNNIDESEESESNEPPEPKVAEIQQTFIDSDDEMFGGKKNKKKKDKGKDKKTVSKQISEERSATPDKVAVSDESKEQNETKEVTVVQPSMIDSDDDMFAGKKKGKKKDKGKGKKALSKQVSEERSSPEQEQMETAEVPEIPSPPVIVDAGSIPTKEALAEEAMIGMIHLIF